MLSPSANAQHVKPPGAPLSPLPSPSPSLPPSFSLEDARARSSASISNLINHEDSRRSVFVVTKRKTPDIEELDGVAKRPRIVSLDHDDRDDSRAPSPVPCFEDVAAEDMPSDDDEISAASAVSHQPNFYKQQPEPPPQQQQEQEQEQQQSRKKPYIPRPPNSFILYRQHHHPLILNQHPGINNSEISRIIADHWRNLPNHEKEEWKRKAEEAKATHKQTYPGYKYQPRRRPVTNSNIRRTMRSKIYVPGPNAAELVPDNRQDTDSLSRMSRHDFRVGGRLDMHRGPPVFIVERSRELNQIARTGITPTEALRGRLPPLVPALSSSKTTTTTMVATTTGTTTMAMTTGTTPATSGQASRLPPPPAFVSASPQPPISSPSTTSRGAMIVLEGCEDGSTALQASKLIDFLNKEGIPAKLWKFPNASTPAGEALTRYQHGDSQPHPKTLHLLLSAHWWELMPTMKDQLLDGVTLVVERYVYSAIAASAAAGIELNWCKTSYVQLLSPDLILLLRSSDSTGANVNTNVNTNANANINISTNANAANANGNINVNGNVQTPVTTSPNKERTRSEDEMRSAGDWQRRMQDAFGRLQEPHWKVFDTTKSNTLVHAQIIEASIEVIEKCRRCNTSYGTTPDSSNNILSQHIPGEHHQQMFPPPIGRRFATPVHVQL